MTALIEKVVIQQPKLEPYFYQFFQDVVNTMPKVDPDLLIRVMMFQVNLKKYPGPDIPHVNLYVKYRDGVDLHQKQEEGRDTYPFEVTTSRWGDGVIFSGLMSIGTVESVCSDPDIVEVTGEAKPTHN